MAFEDDLRTFLEGRLIAYDPAIDLSSNSPAQLKIITPTLQRFGEDPFETDIPTFIRDRMLQEFPDMSADNAGMLEDILAKPLQMLLEPFKREIELVKLGSSVANAPVMAAGEADALGANWFTARDDGDYSSGPVRLFFAQPTTTRVSTDKRVYTSDGRSYFPIQNYFISMSQMAFNRQGSFYFLDVTVRAETTGDSYNITTGEISGIEEVPGVVKVTNLTAFTAGNPTETNEEYIERIEDSLTEKSTTTKRGILARVSAEFESVRALQVIGAGEAGMDRDILTGAGQGFLNVAGKASVTGDWLWVNEYTYLDDGAENSVAPQPGDTIRFHDISPAGNFTNVKETKITDVIAPTGGEGYVRPVLFFVEKPFFDDDEAHNGAFAIFKPGTITISGVPGGMAANAQVADNTVHLGGHTDVYVRPNQDAEVQTTINNVTDNAALVAIVDLVVPTANQNLVRAPSSDLLDLKVVSGDLLVIETGAGFAGTYQILDVVNETDFRVSSIFSLATTSSLRARIVRNIRLDLVTPKVPKLPFTNSPISDLQTNVGSNEFKTISTNVQDYGVKVGDTINVLEGPDAGEFTIVSFGNVAGSVFVDRVPTATGANLNYEIYAKQVGVNLPLVRIKGIEVLDSTGQTTGITVPYGDAVDIRPDGDFEGAGQATTTYDSNLIVFPDLSAEWGAGGLAADPVGLGSVTNATDARYTLGLAAADGVVRKVTNNAANQIDISEINVPPFLYNGRRDKLIALTTHEDFNYPSSIAGKHMTSDIAEAKIGDTLTINEGPNQGKYIIVDHRVLEIWSKTGTGHRKVALIQVDPPLKSDPIRAGLDIINKQNGSPFFTANDLFGFLQYAADWDNASGFFTTYFNKLQDTLTDIGVGLDDSTMLSVFNAVLRSSYTVGPAAKGKLRTYFVEPVSMELQFGTDPTTFDLASDGSKKFRLAPDLPPAQIIPESIEPTLPSLWDRDISVRYSPDDYAFLSSSPSFPMRGVREGDSLEFHPAINDLPSRVDMTSSWMCVTQAGSNIVQLILPHGTDTGTGGVENFLAPASGQLFNIDSGPDTGAYVVTKVLTANWGSNPPVIRLQLDRPLTHTTENFPLLSTVGTPPAQLDFTSGLPASIQGTTITFPATLNGKWLEIDYSNNGGTTFSTVAHQFSAADPYSNIAAVLADFVADTAFLNHVTVKNIGNTLIVVNNDSVGDQSGIRISTSPPSPSAHSILGFTNGTEHYGYNGAVTQGATKKLYGSDLDSFLVNDWITIYAAQSDGILTDGDDTAVIGTYKVTAVGTDALAPQWGDTNSYVELDRTDNFPAGDPVQVRWLRHEEPDTEPANTTAGGKEISDQFVRFRMYSAVSKKISILDIPWTAASVHPLDPSSEQQIHLAESMIDSGNGETGYSHKSPYRIVRPNVLRVSSTNMALQREGALYYVDVPVVGYGPGEEMNVSPADGFVFSGVRSIEGYTLEVDNEIFTYSMKEKVFLVLPNSVLPVGSTAELNNLFDLSGQNLQITYNNAPVVDDLQSFFDSALDRVTAASTLVRHFLPGYVFIDAIYSGGSDEAVVATEINTYVNNIDPDTAEIRTDLVKDAITRRGATTVDLPLTVIVLFHGTDRRIRGMRSTKSVGIGDAPFFEGHFLQTYFIAGPDTSKTTTRPTGEQTFLRRT